MILESFDRERKTNNFKARMGIVFDFDLGQTHPHIFLGVVVGNPFESYEVTTLLVDDCSARKLVARCIDQLAIRKARHWWSLNHNIHELYPVAFETLRTHLLAVLPIMHAHEMDREHVVLRNGHVSETVRKGEVRKGYGEHKKNGWVGLVH